MDKQWVYGAMANYITTLGNSPTGRRTDQMLTQPFFNYNFPHAKGVSMSYSPQITADFTRAPGDQWTLPVLRFFKSENSRRVSAWRLQQCDPAFERASVERSVCSDVYVS